MRKAKKASRVVELGVKALSIAKKKKKVKKAELDIHYDGVGNNETAQDNGRARKQKSRSKRMVEVEKAQKIKKKRMGKASAQLVLGEARKAGPGREGETVDAAASTASAAVDGASNWERLRQKMGAGKKRRGSGDGSARRGPAVELANRSKAPAAVGDSKGLTRVLALDCEMVGIGREKQSALAHVAIVNGDGHVVYESHCKPEGKITDFRTRYSGVTPGDLKNAPRFREVRAKVEEILKGRVLVGHALSNDIKALQISHPPGMIRDTALYPPLMSNPAAEGKEGKPRARSLRVLAQEQLGLTIQEGAHSPVDDARCALYLYLKHKRDWESALKKGLLKGKKMQPQDGPAKKAKKVKAPVIKNAVGRKMSRAKVLAGGALKERPELYDI